ncbi:hypothetical protein BKA69DRAFT_330135 [Paraphysoderma sedebokerense]|nr:hypothetical protein BKA69DRAFT_330135 [Paraphysoderma sedebokerense]
MRIFNRGTYTLVPSQTLSDKFHFTSVLFELKNTMEGIILPPEDLLTPNDARPAAALLGIFVGIALPMGLSLVASSNLSQLRKKNLLIYYSIIVGSIIAIFGVVGKAIYEYFASKTRIWLMVYHLGVAVHSYCLYIILVARIIPVLPFYVKRNHLPQFKLLSQTLIPLIMNLPQIIVLFIQMTSKSNLQVVTSLTAVGKLIYLTSNITLTLIFLRALSYHRSKSYMSIKSAFYANPTLTMQLICAIIIEIAVIILKFIVVSPGARRKQSNLLLCFHMNVHSISSLITFKAFLFVTTELPRQILSTQISVE